MMIFKNDEEIIEYLREKNPDKMVLSLRPKKMRVRGMTPNIKEWIADDDRWFFDTADIEYDPSTNTFERYIVETMSLESLEGPLTETIKDDFEPEFWVSNVRFNGYDEIADEITYEFDIEETENFDDNDDRWDDFIKGEEMSETYNIYQVISRA